MPKYVITRETFERSGPVVYEIEGDRVEVGPEAASIILDGQVPAMLPAGAS